jgi:hypothetical protein
MANEQPEEARDGLEMQLLQGRLHASVIGKAEVYLSQLTTYMSAPKIAHSQSGSSLLRDEDYDAWLLNQISALKEQRLHLLDLELLAEELEDMSALRRDALRSDLVVVLTHMLTLAYESRPNEVECQERQWKLHLAEHRDRVNDILNSSGTLRATFEAFKIEAYARA